MIAASTSLCTLELLFSFSFPLFLNLHPQLLAASALEALRAARSILPCVGVQLQYLWQASFNNIEARRSCNAFNLIPPSRSLTFESSSSHYPSSALLVLCNKQSLVWLSHWRGALLVRASRAVIGTIFAHDQVPLKIILNSDFLCCRPPSSIPYAYHLPTFAPPFHLYIFERLMP